MCVRHGVDVIYHASYIDDEGMDMLEAKKDRHIVAPGLNWLIATREGNEYSKWYPANLAL
jgi:imidazolonepropionase-like amidohydrolase